MVRQARSEATRQRIIAAAVDVFNETGYPSSGPAEIVERAQMTAQTTKGAFYYHFESKEDVAVTIIADGGAAVVTAFQEMAATPAPALETMIHGSFVVAELLFVDKTARTAAQLTRALAGFSDAAARAHGDLLAAMAGVARRAQAEGDLRGDLDSEVVAACVTSAMSGTALISTVVSGGEALVRRLRASWEILLPAIAAERALPYLREFLARESLRCRKPALTID